MGQGMPKSASLPPKDTNKGTIVKQAKRRKLAIPPSQPHLQISKPSSGERMSEDDLKLVVGSSHWVSREVEGEYPCKMEDALIVYPCRSGSNNRN